MTEHPSSPIPHPHTPLIQMKVSVFLYLAVYVCSTHFDLRVHTVTRVLFLQVFSIVKWILAGVFEEIMQLKKKLKRVGLILVISTVLIIVLTGKY